MNGCMKVWLRIDIVHNFGVIAVLVTPLLVSIPSKINHKWIKIRRLECWDLVHFKMLLVRIVENDKIDDYFRAG